MLKFYLKTLVGLCLLTFLSSCNSLFGITDLGNVDFSTAQIQLRPDNSNQLVSTVLGRNHYQLKVVAYDVTEKKMRSVQLNKQVQITMENQNLVSYSNTDTWSYNFTVTPNDLALLEQGFLEITLLNVSNGSKQTIRYPTRINPRTNLVLQPDRNGNGANATLLLALLNTNLMGQNQGPLLLVIDQTTGQSYTVTPNVLIMANGVNGQNGARGANGDTAWRRRGQNGFNGGNGWPGGNGGNLVLQGSKEALQAVSTQVNGGRGGSGGIGGSGGRGDTLIMSLAEANAYRYDIEFMRALPNQNPNDIHPRDQSFYDDTTRKSNGHWNPPPPDHNRPPQGNGYMVWVKFYDGLPGVNGLNGHNGLNGTVTKIETQLDFFNQFKFLTSNSQILENLS